MVVLLALWWPRVVLAAMWCNYKDRWCGGEQTEAASAEEALPTQWFPVETHVTEQFN